MALELDQIITIIKAHQTVPTYIKTGRAMHTELLALVEGDGFHEELIHKIEHIESPQKQEVRLKYSRSIKDTFERLLRPIDNVFNATGSSKEYNVTAEANKQTVLDMVGNIRGGKSVEQWLEAFWIKLYHVDPNGLVFMEWKGVDEDSEARTWPTYKSINNIRGYQAEGQEVKWVLFEHNNTQVNGEDALTWRFVDDKFDYTFIQQGEVISQLEDQTFDNPFRKCPALVNSDIIKVNKPIRLSPLYPIVDVMKEYARDQSIKTIYKFLHGFPMFWKYVQQCTVCTGTGIVDGAQCGTCHGHGYLRSKDVTDAITLPAPKTKEDFKLAPDIAGFITPPLDIWERYDTELNLLENLAHKTHWGSFVDHSANETATARFIDIQPVEGKLDKYSSVGEGMEKAISNLVIRFVDQSEDIGDQGAQITWGRGFIMEPMGILLEKYSKARESGDNTTILDRLFNEYLTSKYKTDPLNLERSLVKAEVEPFIHYTIEQVLAIYGQEKAQEKGLFRDWWETIDPTGKTAEQLKKEFGGWVKPQVKINQINTDDSSSQ